MEGNVNMYLKLSEGTIEFAEETEKNHDKLSATMGSFRAKI